jgi:hypothetical protein
MADTPILVRDSKFQVVVSSVEGHHIGLLQSEGGGALPGLGVHYHLVDVALLGTMHLTHCLEVNTAVLPMGLYRFRMGIRGGSP